MLYGPDRVMGNISPYTAQRGEIASICEALEHENIPLLYSISPSSSSLYPPPVYCHFVCLCTSVFDGAVDVGPYASFPLPEDSNRSLTTKAVYLLFDKVTLNKLTNDPFMS